MKRWILLSLLLVPLLARADGFWDGNAALQRGDAAFESGLFAVSNSFPSGTEVMIQDQDTGKTVTATITGRIQGQSDILVLLSPKTAEALGLPQGTLGRVRVTVIPPAGSIVSAQPGDQTVSSDPDLNPAAAYGGPETVPVAATPEAVPPAAVAVPAETPPAVTPETPAQEQPAAAPQASVASTAPASPNADDAAIISAAESRMPQKQVFQPPREDEKFAYHPPAAATPPAVAAASPAEAPQAATPAAAPPENPALTPPEPAPASQTAQGPVQTEVTDPAAVPPAENGPTQIALLPPEAPAPSTPAAAPVQKAAPPTQKAAAPVQKSAPPVQTASSLPRTGAARSYFLQLGAYGTEKVARDLAAKLAATYPALVLTPSSSGTPVFKVVIGPLNRAESGTLLTWFRYRGFPDAFLKQE